MIWLCYFIVTLFQVLAGGSRYPRAKQTSLVLFLFLVRERDVNERASSDTGEAGFNEMRVQFTMQGGHDLTAIHCLYSMPRGYRSRHRDTHEIMLSVLYLGLRSRVWLQYCIILNTVLKLLRVLIDVTWFIVASSTGSSREVHLVVGSGPVPYKLLGRFNICL